MVRPSGFPVERQRTIVTGKMYEFISEQGAKGVRLIELTQRDVKDATRLLTLLLGAAQPETSVRPLIQHPDQEKLLGLAKRMFAARKLRERLFNPGIFGEAAWDILLILYVMDNAGPRLSVTRLMQFAGVPITTGLRWLSTLESQQLIQREPHPNDARSFYVLLSDKARELMETYLSETLASET